jgi:hypothetical protein
MPAKTRHNRVCPLFQQPVEVDPPTIYGDWSVFLLLSKDRWRARCVCGLEKDVVSYALKYGRSTGCGCRAHQKMAEANKAKLAGQTFALWYVIEEAPARGNGNQIQWTCRCACGVIRSVHTASLVQGKSKSCGCIKTLGLGEYARRITLRNYVDSAKKRGHEWILTRAQAFDLFARPCNYCGLPPANVCRRSTGAFIYSGIDRQDSLRGYEPENCVPCCNTCNAAKGTMSEAQFRAWLLRVLEHGFLRGYIHQNGDRVS